METYKHIFFRHLDNIYDVKDESVNHLPIQGIMDRIVEG